MDRVFIKLGSVLAFLAVLFGAMGAHALKRFNLPAIQMEDWQIGAQYQMYHALGLILIGLCIDRLGDSKNARMAGWVFLAGIVCFSGGLYAFALTGNRVFGAPAPIGGTCFMVGWLLLAAAAWKAPQR